MHIKAEHTGNKSACEPAGPHICKLIPAVPDHTSNVSVAGNAQVSDAVSNQTGH